MASCQAALLWSSRCLVIQRVTEQRAQVALCFRECQKGLKDIRMFSRMRSEGSRFTWGSGGGAVFAKFCVFGRNRSQVFATVRNRPRVRCKALHSGECVWRGPKSVSS